MDLIQSGAHRAQHGAAGAAGVVAAADTLLDQCAELVKRAEDAYTRASALLPGGTIGMHVRHALDHFAPLFNAEPGAVVNYDRRERRVPMETDRAAALDAIARLRRALAGTSDPALARPVTVRVMLSATGAEADLESTFGRELAFVTHHAIHHHAMVRAIAQEHGVLVLEGVGVAPSTAAFAASSGR